LRPSRNADMDRTTPREDYDLQTRVWGEFREMPGLRLTLPQASRLFRLDRERCERVLGALVDRAVLCTDGKAFRAARPRARRRVIVIRSKQAVSVDQ
jgi:hypothetical protein